MTGPEMPRLTTHVLDTASGKPAAGMRVELRLADRADALADTTTNKDGRLDKPLLEGETFKPGVYEIIFHVGNYYRARGQALPEPAFLESVPVRVGLGADRDCHVPLLISPFGYSTYRGS
jgi:5-hydroxyisourate hydrolase